MLSFMWLSWPGNPYWVPPFPVPWAGVSKSSAITISKCRSCFSLAGLWYRVMESRFCVSAAILVPRLHTSSGKHRIIDWNQKLRSKGHPFFVATLFGETGHLCSNPWQSYPLRGGGYQGWGLSLCYGMGLDNIGSNWNRRQISQQRY